MPSPSLAISVDPEVHTKVQRLKATVSLAETFPLSLQDQIMPIIDLMVSWVVFHVTTNPSPSPQALNTPHFAKVKDFINMQMPSGFPAKLGMLHMMSHDVT